jgi:hypothetical protein
MPASKDLGDDRLPGLENEELSQLLKHLGLEAPLCVTAERTSVDDDIAAEAEHGVSSEGHCARVTAITPARPPWDISVQVVSGAQR